MLGKFGETLVRDWELGQIAAVSVRRRMVPDVVAQCRTVPRLGLIALHPNCTHTHTHTHTRRRPSGCRPADRPRIERAIMRDKKWIADLDNSVVDEFLPHHM